LDNEEETAAAAAAAEKDLLGGNNLTPLAVDIDQHGDVIIFDFLKVILYSCGKNNGTADSAASW